MSDEQMLASAEQLAGWLKLSPRRLNQLVDEGVLRRAGKKFDLEASVGAYCEWLRRDEETRKEKRALLRAQADAARARASRQAGITYTHDEIRKRLADPIADLWSLRAVVSLHRTAVREANVLSDERQFDVLCHELHGNLSALIAQARDRMEGAFPPPVGTSSDAADRNTDDEA